MALCRINVHSNMLLWAIERAGDDAESIAVKGLDIQKWIDGERMPTLCQLKTFAKHFHVPLGYMFLQTPPHEPEPITMFRAGANVKSKLNVTDLVKLTTERQEWLSVYLRNNGFSKIDFVGCCIDIDSAEIVSGKIREILKLPTNWAFAFSHVEEALNHLVAKMEDLGVMVNFNSVVGYNSSRHIEVADCRGFALVDDYAPFIYVNSKDAKSAQVFTLIHEFAHVVVGYTAGIGENDIDQTSAVERLCDRVAALLLVPENLLKEEYTKVGENYEVLSKRFKVSRYVIARRLAEICLISRERMSRLYGVWKQEPVSTTKSSDGGGNFYWTAIRRSGRTFLIHLSNAVAGMKIQPLDAYRLAGMKGDSFRKVINRLV